ncbi:rhamnogalacturonan acetylesterase [Marinicrinis lubricantis]|uniref:Rhamnogalacturonan acetylesterase n=1 Tax=Marinicrinis lubricantis TaxID=2086470 RepID=A0ABW1IRQ7_9BACL
MNERKSIHIYLAGDSTVQTYREDVAPQGGWGQFIDKYFLSEATFHNHAIGGRSSKTFITEGRLDAILEKMEPGDYLWIQMGHNDATKSRPERYTEPFTDYKAYLKQYVSGARGKQAHPLLITPVARLHQAVDGSYINDFPTYCEAIKQVADEEQVPLIDLMSESLAHFSQVGEEEVHSYFMVSVNGTDHTHFTLKGADAIANVLAHAIQATNLELRHYVKKESLSNM